MAALAKSAPQAVQHIHFPNESPQYRRARNALLEPPPGRARGGPASGIAAGPATTICSTRSGTCSTLRRKGGATSNPSSTTRRGPAINAKEAKG